MLADWNRVFWPRRFLVAASALAFLAAFWLLAAGYPEVGRWLGRPWALGDEGRRLALAGWSALLLARVVIAERRLHDGWRRWEPAARAAAATLAYQLGLALAGAGCTAPLGGPLDALALLLLLAGAAVHHATLPPHRPGAAGPPVGRGGGLRDLVRHPDHLGDLAWGLGAALLTGQPLALLAPALHLGVVVGVSIPDTEWRRSVRRRTLGRPGADQPWRLIPFVY